MSECKNCQAPLVREDSELIGLCATCRMESSKPKLRLRIFAYHCHCIETMSRDDFSDFTPIEGLRIRVSRTSFGTYRVNGESVGNSHGATEQFAKLVTEYCRDNGFDSINIEI